ncbi:YqaA family protein [Patescibacteria group bacterium]
MIKKIFDGLHRLYHWTLSWAAHPYAAWALCGVAFVESSVFPIPPDILLIAMVVSVPLRWARYAFIAASSSVIGGILGYAIGFFFFQTIGVKIIDFYNAAEVFASIGARYSEFAFLTVFSAAFTPIPYKVITISAGFFKISFMEFILASILGRFLRFFIVAALLRIFGEKIKNFIHRYFNILTIIFVVLLVGGFAIIKLLF